MNIKSMLHRGLIALLLSGFLSPASAAEVATCSGEELVRETFSNGAVWRFCWESRIRENLVLTDVSYTPPGGETLQVLSSAGLSQLHVAYDDNAVTYNDITQYGLGGSYLLDLDEADCPQGELLMVDSRPAVCRWRSEGNDTYRTATRSVSTESLNLFSISQVGAYAYMINWTFHSDGAIEPGIGATGALQRNSASTDTPFGRVLAGDPDTSWLSHTHNYYWRLDFDLGDSANDDVFIESRWQQDEHGRRIEQSKRMTNEQALRIDPESLQSWIIQDAIDNARGYRIQPVHNGHRFERTDIEPYSAYDFYVTVARDCERYASQNTRYNPECGNHLLEFANNESLDNADLTVWHRVAFHHVPRNEDQRNMHTHWDGFVMEPVNIWRGTPELIDQPNQAPEILGPVSLSHALGDSVHEHIDAIDADDDQLRFQASELPPGISIDSRGHLSGQATQTGTYDVNLSVLDDQSNTTASLSWEIKPRAIKRRSGNLDWLSLMIVALFLYRRR
ncbi:MAG: putative Ig domain-containing protein [Granulosicoccus sp.]